jgi:hypothetical protein
MSLMTSGRHTSVTQVLLVAVTLTCVAVKLTLYSIVLLRDGRSALLAQVENDSGTLLVLSMLTLVALFLLCGDLHKIRSSFRRPNTGAKR